MSDVIAAQGPQPSQLDQLKLLEEPAPRHALHRNLLGRPIGGMTSVHTIRARYRAGRVTA